MSRGIGSLVVSMVFAAILIGVHGFFYRLLVANDLLSIREIEIEGNTHIPDEEILHLSGLHPGMGIFDFSWDVVIPRLTNRPYILQARGERILPWKVRITIEENLPVGVMVIGGSAFFVDREGGLFSSARSTVVPRIEVGYPVVLEGSRVQDEWVRSLVKYLGKISNLEKVERIFLDKKTGAHVWLRTIPADIWVGHEVLDDEVWRKIFALEQEIVQRKLSVKTINLHRENAIGYQ